MLGRVRLALDRHLTLSNFLDRLMERCGDQVVGRDDDYLTLDGRRETVQRVGGLHAEVCALGRFLIEDAGLLPGGLVAVYRSNDERCFRWFLAIIRAGGIAVPLNPLLSLIEVQRILAHCRAKILVTDTAVFLRNIGSRENLPVSCWIQADGESATLEGFLRVRGEHLHSPPLAPAPVSPRDTVAIFHTSGTQGIPKAAALSSRALLGGRSIAALAAPFFGRNALALIALPWSHIMAVSTALYGLLAGVPGVCLERFDAERAIAAIERYRVTTFVGVPAMLAGLVNAQPPPGRLAGIRVWISGSDHLPEAVRRRLLDYGALARLPGGRRIRPVVLNGYGMVELGGVAMLGIHSSLLPAGDFCVPVPPYRVRVADENGKSVRNGQVGECLVKGPGLASGYWNNPEAGASLFTADGWLRTGDLAVRNALGLVRLVGRAKDVIKCGGYSIYFRELEETMAAHPSVARAAAVGLPHPEKGEIPVGVVELRRDAQAGEEELLAWCRQRLAAYKAPRRIHIMERGSMPQGVTSKVLKDELRKHLLADLRQPLGDRAG
jgi:acyl-CoA synthetase (AMP-forming)/AMP-acid ligase II